ncbi:MAG: MBL fold metallo-hydrolase, partial [Thermoanaerobaculia bacterium]|nr:MBL fold metallo-hydrolase [Thermoanaerobaculia bacterium]
VDAGFGIRVTTKRLAAIGKKIESIDAIVLTHEHGDHVKGVASIAKKHRIPVYATRGTLDGISLDPEEIRCVEIRNDASFQIGELEIHSARTSHDALDPCCFVVEGRDGTRVGVATDLGFVDPHVIRHLSDCDGLFFEANHDIDLLRRGSYPWVLKRRILSRVGHLSNDDSMAALERLLCDRLKILTLIHLSRENNHESIVREMAFEMLHKAGATIEPRISRQDQPAPLVEISRAPVPVERRAPFRQLTLF